MSIEQTGELDELRAQAEGSRPFRADAALEALAALDEADYRKLDAQTKLALGYYLAARRRSEEAPAAPGE